MKSEIRDEAFFANIHYIFYSIYLYLEKFSQIHFKVKKARGTAISNRALSIIQIKCNFRVEFQLCHHSAAIFFSSNLNGQRHSKIINYTFGIWIVLRSDEKLLKSKSKCRTQQLYIGIKLVEKWRMKLDMLTHLYFYMVKINLKIFEYVCYVNKASTHSMKTMILTKN